MESVIYIDILFFCTFAMDLLILTAAGYLTGCSAGKGKLFGGAFFASAICCVFLCLGWNGWISAAAAQSAAVMICFSPKTMRRFLSAMAALWFSTFLVGGGMMAVMTVAGTQSLWRSGRRWQGIWMPWQIFLWAWAVFYILLRIIRRWLESHTAKRQLYCQAEIHRRGKRVQVRGFFDTGNALKQEGKGIPVIELSVCLPLLSRETALSLIRKASLTESEKSTEELKEIAYSALGLEEGHILLFAAEELRLWQNGRETIWKDLWIGISPTPFAGSYGLLIPWDLLEEERK
ncbi:sigma-E processing peptidase SpoIIGA [Anaerotignum lactatifermentans]|uniref:Sigma-E processing peptidase SpoIIGA n=1 Tax=Anaerotignum lactatifermentans TaxID=160404 RepID=A0ABS2GAP9_9FIRM|nr:sigma-E processing peptidase SpoIIGA [Anaerotignum lactatifermentans]MBM6877952.1 sigma-E processing peptidase SpoIIGA [Anaerotignum lactatifermentans]MBM6950127.1 sigma-E processing peptidase SpoIIGA [Anaerotignum lactatifermentans]